MSVLKKIAGFSAKIYEQTTKLQKIYALIGLVLLFALYAFFSAGGGGNEYLGKWQNVSQFLGGEMTTEIEITHLSGKQYSVVVSLGAWARKELIAEDQGGWLKCNKNGRVIKVDKKTGELNFSGDIFTRQQ